MTEPLICPWSEFRPTHVAFCEERLCAWIREPANTWSNLAYLVVGVGLVAHALRMRRFSLVSVGVTAVLVAAGSAVFHASATFFGEVLDVFAMMLFALVLLTQNAARLRGWSGTRTNAAFAVGAIASLGLLLGVRDVGIFLFALTVIAAFALEVRLVRTRGWLPGVHVELVRMVGAFAVAWAVWWLDFLRVAPVCVPERHVVTGHAVWHVVNASCFVFLYRFLVKVPDRSPSTS